MLNLGRLIPFKAHTIILASLVAGAPLLAVDVAASQPQAPPAAPEAVDAVTALKRELVTANHVLFHQGILDGNGHISVRSPTNPNHLFMSRARPPGLVTEADIIELDFDCRPVGDTPPNVQMYSERFIHCAVYRARPDINSIVHSHSPGSVAFSVTDIPLRPILHTAAFLNRGAPVFDVSQEDSATDNDALMIRNPSLAARMAQRLGDQDVLLIRGHGNVVTGKNIPIMAMRAIHTETNAQTLMRVIAMHPGRITYLTDDDIRRQRAAEDQDRQWRLWNVYRQEDENERQTRRSYTR
jgi:ribulose-5-phosphate 4-epimerase/fuculose-1-phosphate aldolase